MQWQLDVPIAHPCSGTNLRFRLLMHAQVPFSVAKVELCLLSMGLQRKMTPKDAPDSTAEFKIMNICSVFSTPLYTNFTGIERPLVRAKAELQFRGTKRGFGVQAGHNSAIVPYRGMPGRKRPAPEGLVGDASDAKARGGVAGSRRCSRLAAMRRARGNAAGSRQCGGFGAM